MEETVLNKITNSQLQTQDQFLPFPHDGYSQKKTSAVVQPMPVTSTFVTGTLEKENQSVESSSTSVESPPFSFSRLGAYMGSIGNMTYQDPECPSNKKKAMTSTTVQDEFTDVANESQEYLRNVDLPDNTDSSISTLSSSSPQSSGSPTGSSSPTGSATSPETLYEVPKKKSRTNYSPSQVQTLEKVFHDQPYPDCEMIESLSKDMDVPESKIKVWFQNKRARWRRRAQVSMQHVPQFMPMSPVLSPVPHYGFMTAGHMMNTSSSPRLPPHFYPYTSTMTSPSSRVTSPVLMQSPNSCRLQPSQGALRTSPVSTTQSHESQLPSQPSTNAYQRVLAPHQLNHLSQNSATQARDMASVHNFRAPSMSTLVYPYTYGSYPQMFP